MKRNVCVRASTGGQSVSAYCQGYILWEGALSACSCCSTTATHAPQKCDYPSSSHTSHWPCSPLLSYFLTPIFPPIRPLAVTQNFWICGYLSSRCCNDKYPYCRVQCRMFQHTGGKDFRVLVCVERHECSPPSSWLRRWDHRQDVVLRAYSCRLSMTDFHYCNCTLITLHSMCVLTCVITYLCVLTYVHMWDSTADQQESTAGNWRKFFSLYRSRSVSKVAVFISSQWFIQLYCGAFPPGFHSPCYNATIHHPVSLERLNLERRYPLSTSSNFQTCSSAHMNFCFFLRWLI